MHKLNSANVLMWAFIAVCLLMAGVLTSLVLSTAVAPRAIAVLNPSATPTQTSTATPTPTPVPPTRTPTPTSTATPTPDYSPTPSPIPPTIAPTATWFYVIPANPTPIPTPVLPAAAPFPSSCDGPGRMNILLVGLDGWDNNYYRAARADTVILVGVNFQDKTAKMLSFPRDLWVPLPGLPVTEGRLNTAYHYGELYGAPGGGPGELSAVLANSFGLRVDRTAVVSFGAFEQGVDAIGGIDINIANPIHDSKYPLRDGSGTIAIDFPAGLVHLDGRAALIYARLRHDSSDFRRMRRQQQVLFAVRDKLLSPATLPHLPALAQVLFSAARTDLSLDDLGLLGCLGTQISQSAISSWVIDNSMVEHTTLTDGAQVLLPKLDVIAPVLESFNAGQ